MNIHGLTVTFFTFISYETLCRHTYMPSFESRAGYIKNHIAWDSCQCYAIKERRIYKLYYYVRVIIQ